MPVELSEIRSSSEVVTGQSCRKCGYSLDGLRAGQRCPECGTPILVPARENRYADNLTHSPMWYLLLVTIGTVAMAVTLVGSFVFSVYVQYRSASWTSLPPWLVATGAITFAVTWLVGVFLVTWKRPVSRLTVPDAMLDSFKNRTATRAAQLIFGTAIILRFFATSSQIAAVETAASVFEYLSLFALAPLCLYLGGLSDWAGDTGGGGRLRNAAWAFIVAGIGLALFGVLLELSVPFKMFLFAGSLLSGVILLVGIILFVLSVLGLSVTASWAVQNASEAREREARIAVRKQEQMEKDLREAERRTAEAAQERAAFEQQAAAGSPDIRMPSAARPSGERVITPSNTDGYALEPEDNEPRP